MNTLKNPIYLAYIILNLVVSLPLYLFYSIKLGELSFFISCLYLAIYIVLNLFFMITKQLKWAKMTSVYLGFFGLKNLMILAFLVAVYKFGYLDSNLAFAICAVYYIIYTVLIARFILNSIKISEH
ncbi:MAG: hypothetical protein KDE33_17630 [Bacteroidetes bacterium]|nr:hypothetical protein [Bacteroidota bacterium]